MQCLGCGFENPEGMKFCGACGAPMRRRCAGCGFENPLSFRFCGACGASLEAPALPSLQPEAPPGGEPSGDLRSALSEEAERRQLTVMFCDVVGSTALSQQLDPEEWRAVLRAYQGTSEKVITRFGGHVAQYLGDGLLVYFGYPQAYEDSARRALRAGLGILEAVGQLNKRLESENNIRLAVRVGVHTGLVVVGMVGGERPHEQLALGDTPHIAARLQALAEPDTLLISAATYRLIEGFFDCRDRSVHRLKGIAQPMTVYQVLHESAARSRLDAAAASAWTPLIGREQEIGLLQERWAQVQEGFGQVVFLSGEPGIGKSRLVQALKEHVAQDPQAWLTRCQCSPYHQKSALYPFIDLLERVVLQFNGGDSSEEKLSKLEGFAVQSGFPLEMVPLFAALLGVPLGDHYAPSTLTPERQKQKILHALLTALLERAARQPVLFVVEDLHWADSSSTELLDLIINQAPTARILVLLTFRPDFNPVWFSHAHVRYLHISLTRLPREQVIRLAEQVAGGKALPEEVLKQVAHKTDGVPLFVEELTKVVLESGLLEEREEGYALRGPLPPLAIPATLRDSLMARLDRLAMTREIAQLGAVLGREFSYSLLHAVSSLDEETLRRALTQLVDAALLYQRGLPPQATYVFKHALIQETAYQSLLKSKRQQYHVRIAQMLAGQFPETVETHPELLAHHYTAAGLGEQAVPYWHRAGQRAIERSANIEAVDHLTRALRLLESLPEAPARTQQELSLQITLGSALIAIKGYAAPEVEQAYTRARELYQQVGEAPQHFPVVLGLFAYYFSCGMLQTARELGGQLLNLARNTRDPAMLVEAHLALGEVLFLLGELGPAQMHLEQANRLYPTLEPLAPAILSGDDPGVACLCWTAWMLWILGYPDRALRHVHEALTLARALPHPFSLAYALVFSAWIHLLCGEGPLARHQADAAVNLSAEQGFVLWLAAGVLLRGSALVEQGHVEEGIAQLRQGLADWCATGTASGQSFCLALLADAYGKAGKPEDGLSVLGEAQTAMETTEERCWEVELYRLEGELLLMQGCDEAAVEARLQQALDLARRQQGKSWELRAALSLSRLWERRGNAGEARALLSGVYNSFTEGFDTTDLKEARQLLEAWA